MRVSTWHCLTLSCGTSWTGQERSLMHPGWVLDVLLGVSVGLTLVVVTKLVLLLLNQSGLFSPGADRIVVVTVHCCLVFSEKLVTFRYPSLQATCQPLCYYKMLCAGLLRGQFAN